MNVIQQSVEIIAKPQNALQTIECIGRTCYKSEDKITPDSAPAFVKMLLSKRHESVFEHVFISVRFITNRGVSHEIVRHRLCAFSQESTRYVNYGKKEMSFILPVWWDQWSEDQRKVWEDSMKNAERSYKTLLASKVTPEKAREVLPNSLKTEIIVTANLREWRYILNLRCSKQAHPQMRMLMRECCLKFKQIIPIIFDDIQWDD